MKGFRLFGIAVVAVLPLLLWSAEAAEIPRQEAVSAVVTTTVNIDTYTSVFTGAGSNGATVTINRRGKVNATIPITGFHMTVSAQQCCTIHAFVLSPWTGTWMVDGQNGDTLSGTADGVIDAGCVVPIPPGGPPLGCGPGPAVIGPGVNFTLTITAGTGRYAGVAGTGSLTGDQTPQAPGVLLPPAAFAGQLSLSVT